MSLRSEVSWPVIHKKVHSCPEKKRQTTAKCKLSSNVEVNSYAKPILISVNRNVKSDSLFVC